MGPWYALWRISLFGHLLHFRSTGVPVVWMITTSSTEATIQFLFKIHISLEPGDHTRDHDQAQLNAITAVYPGSTVLLCWWHVLCAMRMHFQTKEFPRLWECVCEWVKTPNQSKFESWWDEMQNDPEVPLSFLDYLKINWMLIVPMWSGSAWQHRTIFQESDTNMLIES